MREIMRSDEKWGWRWCGSGFYFYETRHERIEGDDCGRIVEEGESGFVAGFDGGGLGFTGSR